MKRIGHGIRRLLRRDNSSYDLHDIAEIDDMHTKSPAVNTKFVLRDNHDPRRHVIRQNIADKQGVVELPKNANNNNKDEKVVEGQDAWVVVHKLKSQSDGGILDLDDRLTDVADDREQIMAIFEEDTDGTLPSLRHNAGDGTSASSVGTNSPDIFQGTEHKFQPFARTDIEITGEELNNGMMSGGPPGSLNSGGVALQVRRGSEPALNRMSPVHLQPPDPSKRWSAAPVIDEDKNGMHHNFPVPESSSSNMYKVANSVISNISNASSDNRESSVTSSSTVFYNDIANNASVQQDKDDSSKISDSVGGTTTEHYTKFLRNKSSGAVSRQINNEGSRFSRDCNRLSMQFFGDGSSKWSDAADRALWMSLRKEPVGTSPNSDTTSESYFSSPRSRSEERSPEKDDLSPRPTQVILRYEVGPLGIHLVPEHNENGQNQGLIVQNVEIGGRIDRNGCLKAQDKIVEINGHSLIGVQFQQAQDLFRQGLNSEELRLMVIKHPNNVEQISTVEIISRDEKENMVHSEEKIVGNCKLATVSSTRKSPLQPAPILRNGGIPLIASNTRKIGRKYEVDLQKGPQGLGFSITTRDNPAGGNCPIYIKNILPHGAAIDDGRLRPGDRLLEVNGIEITGKTQTEAVSILKNIPLGGIVKLIVSRQERIDLSPKLPRQIPPEKITEDLQPLPWSEKEVLEFDIPVLDTEKAGLGISVKGKTATTTQVQSGMIDMGIFIKSVIHGGAASRDGRVKSNDQLISVNGISLLSCSNTQAMETLRKTMTQPVPKPGFITLMVARRVPTSSAPNTDLSGCGSSASGDEMDSWGGPKNVTLFVDGSRNEDTENVSPYRNSDFNTQQSSPVAVSTNHQNMTLGSPTMRQAMDDIVMQAHIPDSNNMQNIINRSRSSSLRKIDILKGKFEGGPLNSNHVQRIPLDLPRNPVLERLTGKNVAASRSDSYYKATTDVSFSPTTSPPVQNGRPEIGNNRNYSPRRNSGMLMQHVNGEAAIAILEDDYSAPQKPPRRSRSSTPEDALDSRIPRSAVPSQVSSPVSTCPGNEAPPSDVTYASQTSLEDAGGFSRDAFGRQSMSEKRHATLDAKSTDTYQRTKKAREERERHKQHEPDADKLRAQRLAEDKNYQDQWARRGIKRPFSSSTEDELASTSPRNSAPTSPAAADEYSLSPRVHWTAQLSNKVQLNKGKPGDRLGLGDQLLQLLHHWGQKRINRQEGIGGLARVNSADSLVDSLKMSAPMHPAVQRDRRSKGIKDIGPSLGMKKSSSLESLQTMVQEIVIQEDMKFGNVPPRSGPQTKVIRGRGCNESFRQAVDRSYEAPLSGLDSQMETLAEEETESCISGAPSSGRNNMRMDLGDVEKPTKKKPGLFRGLGSMFRFGRHRKPTASMMKGQSGDWDGQDKGGHYGSNIDPVQEQYRRLAEKRDARSNAYGTTTNSNDYIDERQLQPSRTSNHYSTGSGSMRVKKQSRKPVEISEQDINGNPRNPSSHLRSASYDVYNEINNRPGSRVGFVDPKKSSSHYINYDEIKQHLNEPPGGRNFGNTQGITDVQLLQMRNTVVEQRKKAILESRRHQQHYHSQRRDSPRERHDRPVSNFYEYESVQAAMHSQQQQPHNQVHNQVQVQGGMPVSQHGHYGQMNTVAIQQQHLQHQSKRNNNNGITLPSPTVPLSMGVMRKQVSGSQFQAVPSFQQNQPVGRDTGRGGTSSNHTNNVCTFSGQSQSQRQTTQPNLHQNSLPRRHHKDPMNYNQPQTSSHSTSQHRQTLQSHQFPSSSSTGGRYAIGPPQGSYSHPQQQQLHNQNQNYGYHHPQNHQVTQPQSSSTLRVVTPQQHSNNISNGGGSYSSTSMSVGSKV
ncbi:partitioning defective 3 homolog isoform X3 [Folsomia candida]|uniref:partitioning defective 3 homolog isoform X3 n=1 Tax=Folsomia candida TaxID=158441 RepID=UPI001604D344|nr:partitioning defective 3 homolog isoform X3 [Folsomia candida]